MAPPLEHPFDATVDGALDHLAHVHLSATSTPTLVQADRLTGQIAARVVGRVGTLEGLDERYAGAARAAVHLGAASVIEAAVSPELARAGNASGHASWLWERFIEALDELAGELEAVGEGDLPDPAAEGDNWGDLGFHFPKPWGLDARWPRSIP